jgi:hypothetical protein
MKYSKIIQIKSKKLPFINVESKLDAPPLPIVSKKLE